MRTEPVSKAVLCSIGYMEHEFNHDHGTDFSGWGDIVRAVGGQVGVDSEEFYRRYLLWFEIYKTPLYQALK